MTLVCLLVLYGLKHNRRVFVRHIETKMNIRADALSRLDFQCFWNNSPPSTHKYPDVIHPALWPLEKVWFD